MKRIHKLLSVLIALAMFLTMGAGAGTAVRADETTKHTITIEKNGTDEHTYDAYQVFSGKLSSDRKTLTDVAWGSGVKGDNLLTALKADTAFNGAFNTAATAADVAEKLAAYTDDSAEAKEFATVVAANLSETKAGTGTSFISVTGDGYYFLKDVTAEGSLTVDTYSEYILKVVGDVTVTPKNATTSSQKKVKDTTDGVLSDWQDSADWNIGDDVPFQLTATVAADYADYSTYKLTFHDEESEGLTFKSDTVKVKVDDNEVAKTLYTVVTTGLDDKCTFEIRFDNLKQVAGVKAGSKVTVEYKATLNDQAVIGSAGNPNESFVEFSNHPYDSRKTGKTPHDKVIVFTYQVVVNKVDGNKNPLPGAGFSLYRKGTDGTETQVREITAGAGTTFTFKGLDDGQYVLKETTVPDGYNKIEDIAFKISAKHETSSDDPKLTSLMGILEDGKTVNLGDSGKYTATVKLSEGSITTDVMNKKGTVLPSTGGIGTRIFYAAGAILVAAAIALLVYRKKMASKA